MHTYVTATICDPAKVLWVPATRPWSEKIAAAPLFGGCREGNVGPALRMPAPFAPVYDVHAGAGHGARQSFRGHGRGHCPNGAQGFGTGAPALWPTAFQPAQQNCPTQL